MGRFDEYERPGCGTYLAVELVFCITLSILVAVSDAVFGPYSFYMVLGVIAVVTAIVGITWAVIRVLRSHDL